MKVLSKCKYPYLLREYFAIKSGSMDEWETLIYIFQEAPRCNNTQIYDVMSEALIDVLAPTVLSVIGWKLVDSQRNADASLDADKAENVVDILRKRKDGFYLTYHYVRYLLWKSNQIKPDRLQIYSDFLDNLVEQYREAAEEQFVKNNRIRFIPEDLTNADKIRRPSEALDVFKKSGIISLYEAHKTSDSIDSDLLLNYRTVKWLLDEDKYKEQLIEAFRQMFAYDSLSFVNTDFQMRLEYYEIAELLINQTDVIKSWDNIQGDMKSMKQRMMYRFHLKGTNEMIYRIRFMWNVNLALLPWLFENDKEKAREFWSKIWNDGLDYIRRYSRYSDIEVEDYLCRLVCYYLVCFVRNGENSPVDEEDEGNVRITGFKPNRPYNTGTDEQKKQDAQVNQWISELMPVFKQIEEIPIVLLRCIVQLLANGLRWEVVLGGDSGEFFRDEFSRAAEIAEGQRTCEWVNSFLKQKKFVSDIM